MYGIGDNLHQRAVLRELMRPREVWLDTFYSSMYHDLVAQGLKLRLLSRGLKPRITDAGDFSIVRLPASAERRKINYDKAGITRYGSILGAQYASVNLRMPERPDFSLPVRDEWRRGARQLIGGWSRAGKPLMVYRPIVLNKTWECPSRSPDPQAYDALYRSIRDRFFVVSIADLKDGEEWIVGPRADVDIELHHGELDFETMTGLFAEADLVFGNAGFAPVLAQAVGTPNIVIYGGNESYRITNRVGAHLAPTLGIDVDNPCECRNQRHQCDKTITLPPALQRIAQFVREHVDKSERITTVPRVLIFATTYVDSPHRKHLVDHWLDLHARLNPDCDFLIVDSNSPLLFAQDFADCSQRSQRMLYRFPDNIGHLSRGGRDGWGRALCKGLEIAAVLDYDYAVHIEGDSLFRRPVRPIVDDMNMRGVDVLSTPVIGTRRQESGWVETGLMLFRVGYLLRSDFVARYDWPRRKPRPTPERVIHDLLGSHLVMMPWRAERGDKSQITAKNVAELDWVTHCWDDLSVYDSFVASVDAQCCP
jgi:hypothetical protein